MGRTPKPTQLKVVTGNPGKRPLNELEPKPEIKRPKVPAFLSPKAKTAWNGLCDVLEDMSLITLADAKSLELLCDAYAQWRDLRKIIDECGHTYQTTTQTGDVMYKARPEVAMAADAWKRVASMLSQFGLTPAGRSKVSASRKPEEFDPLEDFLKRGR
jgi:P27 family predicted phage terminase small subunit